MLASTFAALLALVASQAWARPAQPVKRQQDVCSLAPFADLLCLKGAAAARSACSSMLPIHTVTTTLSTTTFDVVTVTRSFDAETQSTVFSENPTGAFSQTTLTTTVGDATSFATGTTTITLSPSTVTTYISTSAPAASSTAAATTAEAVKRQATSCSNADALSSLQDSACPTACSCLGFPRRTRTVTKTATFGTPSTTTSILGQAPVTTIVSLAGPTVIETVTNAASTVAATATVSFAPTTTVTLAAPTYTAVYGPTAGCADMVAFTGLSLGSNVTDAAVAESECKDLCTRTPRCRNVWVQHLFTNWGAENQPFFACYINARPLKADRDLECGRPEGVFGVANAWDAVGRGTVPL